MEEKKTISKITGMHYIENDCVFFRNTLQSAFYINNGATLLDLFVDKYMKIVFVFSKSDHEDIKLLWKNANIGR